jgi:hypothetical protein
MNNDNNLVTSASRPQTPLVPDRKVARINAKAEQKRLDAEARAEQQQREHELDLQRRRDDLALRREQREAKGEARRERRAARQQRRTQLAAKVCTAVPAVGRSIMIAGPILAPMAVAWIGQIGFALSVLHWVLPGAVVFAASWELTTMFCGWMYHEARKAGDHGTLFRIATWMSASGAAAMNYWHNCPVVDGRIQLAPTPKAVAYSAMSLVGIALWELYCALVHRKALRARGILPPARPRFGVARWLRYTRVTWWAWSLTIRHGYTTTEQAWAAAVAEVACRDRVKATLKATAKRTKARKKNAKAGRIPIRVTAIWHQGPKVARQFGLTQWTAPPIVWLPTSERAPVVSPPGNPWAEPPKDPPGGPPPGLPARVGRSDAAGPGTNSAQSSRKRSVNWSRSAARSRSSPSRRSCGRTGRPYENYWTRWASGP